MRYGLADRAALNNFMQSVVPFDIATCMYYTGIDPFTRKPVHTAKNLRDRKMQRALMQFFKPENYFEVREADQSRPRRSDRRLRRTHPR